MSRKDLIVSRAKELISKFGFKKTTMEDIARAARIGKATIYYYFGSKEEILRDIIEKEGEYLRKVLDEVVRQGKTAKEKLHLYLMERFRFLQKLDFYYRTIRNELYTHLDFIERERKKFDGFDFAMLENILKEGVKKGEFKPVDTRSYAFLLLHGIRGLECSIVLGESFVCEDKNVDHDYALKTFLDILLHGITAS